MKYKNIKIMNDNSKDRPIACFICIPKCGTRTIKQIFGLDDFKKSRIIYEGHTRLSVFEKKYNLENIYTFTCVRHPYERIKSWYYYHRNNENIKLYKSQTLNQWIENGCKTHWTIMRGTNWEKENLSPLLQYNFIDGKKNINYIAKIENFKEDCKIIISQINKILGNNDSKKLKYINIKKNISKGKKDNITDKNKDLIYQMFKKDFDYFQYKK